MVALVDGQNAIGFVAMQMGMQRTVGRASGFGIGMVCVKHPNHFGMSAWVVQQAIDAGMLSLGFTIPPLRFLLGWSVQAHRCFTFCLWCTGWQGTSVYSRHDPVHCCAWEDLQGVASRRNNP